MKTVENEQDKNAHVGLLNPRKVFSKFATGVCIILIECKDGACRGLTINSFSSLSLEPLLVTFSIKTKSVFASLMDEQTAPFSINILQKEQIDLSKKCSMPGENMLSTELLELRGQTTFSLKESMAVIGCKISQKLCAGDHTIYICEVKTMFYEDCYHPLLFLNGTYHSV